MCSGIELNNWGGGGGAHVYTFAFCIINFFYNGLLMACENEYTNMCFLLNYRLLRHCQYVGK